MSFIDLVKKRVSVRGYENRDVEDDKIMKVLDAGRYAPSACNNQPWTFVVIRSDAGRLGLKAVYDREWFLAAPVIIAVCVDKSKTWKRSHDRKDIADVDGAIAMDHMILAATELGLGTCWIGAFDPVAARSVLNLPESVECIAFTPLGYPCDAGREKRRNAMDDVVKWEKF